MANDEKKSLNELHKQHRDDNMQVYEKLREDHMKHWRAWGSWFSWGSPVGLGLFFLAVAGCIWILGQTFNW